jgi:hypothetical protein
VCPKGAFGQIAIVLCRLLDSFSSVDIPAEREQQQTSAPEPEPMPSTSLPVYVMLPLDTIWLLERDGKSVRAHHQSPRWELCAAHALRGFSQGPLSIKMQKSLMHAFMIRTTFHLVAVSRSMSSDSFVFRFTLPGLRWWLTTSVGCCIAYKYLVMWSVQTA